MATLSEFLKSIADAIRTKKESSDVIPAQNFASEILSIETGIDTSDATASASDLLSGKVAYGQLGKIIGAMQDNGAISSSLNAGESYSVPAGYHNGSGSVRANPLSSQTQGTATATDVAKGKTAWVNGNMITGSGSMLGQLASFDIVNINGGSNEELALCSSAGVQDFVDQGVNSGFECYVGEYVTLVAMYGSASKFYEGDGFTKIAGQRIVLEGTSITLSIFRCDGPNGNILIDR